MCWEYVLYMVEYTMAMKRKGFTLIELLVVIAIIGILVAVATVSYTTIQKRSRDSRRVTDLKAVQQAFEQYYGDNSMYPTGCSLSETYLPLGFPIDPKNSVPYVYSGSSCTAAGYCYCALLETGSGNAASITCGAGSGSYFCIKQLQ